MRLYSNLVVRPHRWQVLRQVLRFVVRHIAAPFVQSRLQSFKVMLVMLQLAYFFGAGAAIAEARNDQPVAATSLTQPVSTNAPVSRAQTDIPSSLATPPVLSREAEQVSRIAVQNGDKEFLMVDKANGELILFENGKPIFKGPALTGASMGDRIPPNVLTISGSHKLTLNEKVTPAGRFTVTAEADPAYGKVWAINEIHGTDWDIVIHQVYLGFAAEHRDARLHSANIADHHITFGCINVDPSTVQALSRHLPQKAKVPLYILPNDTSLIAALFPLRDPPSATKSVAAKVTSDHSR